MCGVKGEPMRGNRRLTGGRLLDVFVFVFFSLLKGGKDVKWLARGWSGNVALLKRFGEVGMGRGHRTRVSGIWYPFPF